MMWLSGGPAGPLLINMAIHTHTKVTNTVHWVKQTVRHTKDAATPRNCHWLYSAPPPPPPSPHLFTVGAGRREIFFHAAGTV